MPDTLAYLHVFAWVPGGIGERYPFADGVELWTAALAIAADAPALPIDLRSGPATAGEARPRYCLLEYVADDDPEQLVTDAATLTTWIKELQPDAS